MADWIRRLKPFYCSSVPANTWLWRTLFFRFYCLIFAWLSVICGLAWGGFSCISFGFEPLSLFPWGMLLVIAIQSMLLSNSREFCALSINPPLAWCTRQLECLSYHSYNKGQAGVHVLAYRNPQNTLLCLLDYAQSQASWVMFTSMQKQMSFCILNCIFPLGAAL